MNSSKASDNLHGSEIAIIGMAGRFPGARDIEAFWENLRNGVESVTFFSDEQLQAAGISPEILGDPNYVKARSVLEDVELFDAAFFGFTPREAECMDPQHRLFLECVWQALENAGYDPESYRGAIGVYAGANLSTYLINNLYGNPKAMARAGEYQCLLANVQDSLTTRVAYKLNLKGPCFTVQTFCSTSLVAVHVACQSLLGFECDIAVAGGVSVLVPQNTGYRYQEGLIVSPDGHCRPFDARAQGTVFGSGAGAVVLKRLDEALAAGDHIEAVILGSAVNNDGSLKVSYTAPSVVGQAEVIVEALANAGVEPKTITYVETHGTGTALGDPTEVTALTRAFRTGTEKKGFCAIGSVKSNIGHLDAAAGVASLIKTVLALKNQAIPPTLHFQSPNPEIDFSNSPFYVNARLSKWESKGGPRRAGVSAFGIGGTNAHVVLEEAPGGETSGPSRPRQLLLLSARLRPALDAATANLSEYLTRHPAVNIADVAYTLQTGRKAFNHRRFAVCSDVADAVERLKALDPSFVGTRHLQTRDPEVAFMFPGQGAYYLNMGLNLYQREPLFRQSIDECAEILEPILGQDIRRIVYPKGGDSEEAAELLRKTSFQQPALFTIEYSLAKLWENWGLRPAAMIGHSIGEYVAACIAGVFSLQDALMLVAIRARIMQELPGGAMLSIAMPAAEIESKLDGELSIAAVNAPSLCVVSGPTKAIAALQQELERESVICRYLHTSHAFHSPMMDCLIEPFAERVRAINLSPPTIPFISTVTGTWITSRQAADPMYWARQLRATVRFAEGVQQLWEKPERVLLEVGPRATCCTLARKQARDISAQTVIASLGDTALDESEWTAMSIAIGKLWLAGVQIRWENFYQHERRRRLALPTYPFERKRFWVEPVHGVSGGGAVSGTAELETPADQPEPVTAEGASYAASEHCTEDEYDAPRTKAEILLAAIWQEVLGVGRVGRDDNYFSDLGGDSLSVARVVEIVRQRNGVRLDPKMFPLNTLRQIAPHLKLDGAFEEPKPAAKQIARQPVLAEQSVRKKVEIIPRYFGNSSGKLFGVYHAPRPVVARDAGILLCYPIGQEYMTAHWAFRRLSSLLSRAGLHVFRFDYFGTGDSAGESGQGNVSRWQADIRSAADELMNMSKVKKLSIVGLRFGASLALQTCANGFHVEDLLLWDPVVDGRNYVASLQAMHKSLFPAYGEQAEDPEFNELLGFPFPSKMRSSIEQVNLLEACHLTAKRALIIVSEERNEYLALRDHLIRQGIQLDYRVVPDESNWDKAERFDKAVLVNDMLHAITALLSATVA